MMTPSEARLAYAGRAWKLAATIKGPGGEYQVEVQDDGRWTVEHIIENGPYLFGTSDVGNYPTREDAMYYARRYASGHPRPGEYTEHPLPDRKAAIAYTKALS